MSTGFCLRILEKEDYLANRQLLISYTRKRRRPTGIVIGVKMGDEIRYGWSKCNLREDKWSKFEGLKIAFSRIFPEQDSLPVCIPGFSPLPPATVPHEISKALQKMEERCKRYFKVEP